MSHHKIQTFAFLFGAALIVLCGIFFSKDIESIFKNDWAGNTSGVPQTSGSSATLYDFISTVPQQFLATGCDGSLWQHNAEDEKVSAACLYVTGVVERVKPEDDGDMNIQLKPDPEYTVLLNSYNIKDGGGNLGIEPICVVDPSRPEFKIACKGYSNRVTIPSVGMHIGVKGSYGQDKHYWMEIHPVTSIDVL